MFRSKAFHIIMPVIFVGAAVILGFLSIRTFVNIFDWGGAELSAPGESTVDVHKAGGFKFWNKVTTVQDGKLEDHPHEVPSGTVITIRRLRDGAAVPWVESIGMRMTTNGDSRVSFGSVSFTEPGRCLFGRDDEHVLLDEGLRQRADRAPVQLARARRPRLVAVGATLLGRGSGTCAISFRTAR